MNAQALEWNDLRFVLAVCREGTLSGAARVLSVNHSTVFRRIAAIEDKLGVRLFERLPSGYAMTTAGEAALESTSRIEEEALGLLRRLVGGDFRLRGVVRVTAPDALSLQVVLPHLAAFKRTYAEIQIELLVVNQFSNLTRREADVAIRSTTSPPEMAVGRRVCVLAGTVYGSEEYLDAHSQCGLGEHTWLMPDESMAPYPAVKWLSKHHPNARIGFRTNSLPALQTAVQQGMGVAPLPCFVGDCSPGLRRLLAPPADMASELWILTHPDLRRTARVRALVDFLSEAIGKERDRIEGTLA